MNAYPQTDLFWALRVGGGGFGVVNRVTFDVSCDYCYFQFFIRLSYTEASYHGLLQTHLNIQPALIATNFSGYTYPSPTNFNALLFVHNSADLAGLNSTLQPFYSFASNETAGGRPVTIEALSTLLTNYMQVFFDDPQTVEEGAGMPGAVLGGRLLPLSSFQGASADALVDLIDNTPFGVQMHLST